MLDIIARKRDGFALSKEEIEFLVKNYTNGVIPDYQMSAFLMATYFQKMTDEESTFLAIAMKNSGDSIDLSSIDGIKVDKHSTGGVGDKVTLILGPLLASLGVKFAKMSGRGLGHTGGTIDKLESIPGYQVELKVEDFIQQVNQIGIAIVGQSGDVAPADKKLYALRDVTATVDVIPLIASSIMSKKLASGADAIVLDVKVGQGAFMKTLDQAIKLAELMVSIGRLAGKKMTAILTNMDEPLGHKIGNGLEVYEAIETLKGHGPKDLVDVTVEIGAHLLLDSNIEKDFNQAKKRLYLQLNNGLAYQKFIELVKAQGGDISKLEDPNILLSKNQIEILSVKEGYVEKLDALKIGKAAMRLGAGREKKEDHVLFDVGIDLHKKIGDYVKIGDKIATLYVQNQGVEEAKSLIYESIQIGKSKNQVELIIKTIK
jgi:pyrimidine-nucleoside phosphorylase